MPALTSWCPGWLRNTGPVALVALSACTATPARAQVNDLSGSGGQIGSRIEAALQQAGRAESGSSFYIVTGFEGLVPSDAEAGESGNLVINRYGGWMMSGFSGLAPVRNPWDQLGSEERVLDLATMTMIEPGPEPTLEARPLLGFIIGRVTGRNQARIEDVSLRLPAGVIRLRERPLYWLGQASSSEIIGWIREKMGSLDVMRDRAIRRDLVGLLSVQPQSGDVVGLMEILATGDEDEGVRHRAITYLGRRPEDTTRRLTSILDRAEDPQDRAQALEALADRLGPASKDRLIEAARSEREAEQVRHMAVGYLSRVEGRDVDTVLERLLSDPDVDFRRRVVASWERRDPERAVPLLEQVAISDEERQVRETAVGSLGDIDSPQAAAALERIFNSSDEERVRRVAMNEWLQTVDTNGEKVAWLARVARSDPSFEIRKEAVRQLGRTNNPEARKVLEELLRIGCP